MVKGTISRLFAILLLLVITINLNAQHKKLNNYQMPKLPNILPGNMGVYTVIKQDFTLTLRDNVVLDCSKFYPSVPNPFLPNGYPGVVMCHGYGDRKETLQQFANDQAAYGYCVYTYSMRGQGKSGGLSNLISTTEASDLIEVVAYIKRDKPNVGSDTSKILIMGGSQGGLIPYMAACNGMNVRTIIAALASPEFATSWIENGCIKMTLLWTTEYTPDTARYSPQVKAINNWIYSSARDKWDSLAYWLPKDRDFTTKVSSNKIPILLENNWQDYFFNAKGNINSIPNLNVKKKYYFGAVMGHGGDTSGAENTWHMNFFNDWFYYWLFDTTNNIFTRPSFHYASQKFPLNTVGMWTFKHDSSSVWPVSGISSLKLYLNSGNKLKTTANPYSTQYVTLNNTVRNNLTMKQAVDMEFTGSQFNASFVKSTITFDSDPLTSSVKLLGTPVMNFDYSSNVYACQFNVQVYEVSSTKTKLVTRINYADRKNTVNVRKSKSADGMSSGHIFSSGSKIRIIVTNLDKCANDTSFLATNPFVLPILVNGSSKIYLSSNSSIVLPVAPVTTEPITNLFTSTENNIVQSNNNPLTYKLEQNYPNPFNPVTNISFEIPNQEFVTLKVYDLLGREISTLINEVKSPGNYTVSFNGANLSSGVYFYQLRTNTYSQTKRMLMIK